MDLAAVSRAALLLATLAAACARGGPVREGLEPVSGSDLHWETRGSGPPVVLLHGGGLDMRQWDDEVRWLAHRRLVLRFDLRGHGRSRPSGSAWAPHEDVRALLDRLGIGSVVLVGHSNGGRVAVDFALEHPARTKGLFLLAPGLSGWAWDEHELESWLPPILMAVEQGDRELVLERWLESPFLDAARERPDVARELERLARDNVEVWFGPTEELQPDPPAASRLSDIDVPVRVLVGSRDMPDLLRVAEAIGAHVEGAEVVRFPGAGHVLDMEEPERVRAELEGFLVEIGW